MSLRFIMRDGKKILQVRIGNPMGEVPALIWVDVPFVEEPRQPREYWLVTERHQVDHPAFHLKEYAENEVKKHGGRAIKVREVFE